MSRRHEIALGALLHDVGKLLERAGGQVPPAELAPLRRELGAEGDHLHAAYTAWLLGRLEATRSLLFAAKHHRPSTPVEAVVGVADRHAATRPGEPHLDEGRLPPGEAGRRRLTPALSRVRREGAVPPREASHLPLRPLSFRLADLDPAPGDGPTSVNLAKDEYYHGLWDELEKGLAALPADPRASVPVALALLERLGARVPAGPAEVHLDLSLYEHSHLAAALATALYVETVEGRDEADRALVATVEEAEVPRLLLVSGEVSGEEAYRRGLSARTGPAALTGRAVFFSLLADAVAERILESLDLPETSLLWLCGAHFLLLLPRQSQGRLEALASEIDLGLLEIGRGRLHLAWGAAPLALRDLAGPRLSRRWEELAAALEVSRQRPLADLLARAHGYEEVFAVPPQPRAACASCGDDLDLPDGYCGSCTRFEALGRASARAGAFARVPFAGQARAEKALREAGVKPLGSVGLAPLGFAYVAVTEVPERAPDLGPSATLLATGLDGGGTSAPIAHGRRLGLVPPPRRGGEAPCGTLATVSRGAKRWGVLMADLDDLTPLLERGFPESERTLARGLALSRAASHFFAGFAASLAVRDDAVHVVRAQGNSLWAVGPWDRLPGLALAIRDALHRFTGGNPTVGLSAGIAPAAADTPVGAALGASARALSQAKAAVRADGVRKDAVVLFGTTLAWGDAALAAEMAQTLADLEPDLQRRLLPRLWAASASAASPAAPRSLDEAGAALNRGRWTWRLASHLCEIARGAGPAQGLVERLQRALTEDEWEGRKHERPLVELVGLAVRWCRILTRMEGSHE